MEEIVSVGSFSAFVIETDEFVDCDDSAKMLALTKAQVSAKKLADVLGALKQNGMLKGVRLINGDKIGDQVSGLDVLAIDKLLHEKGRWEDTTPGYGKVTLALRVTTPVEVGGIANGLAQAVGLANKSAAMRTYRINERTDVDLLLCEFDPTKSKNEHAADRRKRDADRAERAAEQKRQDEVAERRHKEMIEAIKGGAAALTTGLKGVASGG